VICDSHAHVSTAWFCPVESLLGEMDRNEVDRAILVQIRGQLDNGYQRDCARRFPDRFASVVLVDSPDQLGREVELGAVGVRLRPDSQPELWQAAAGLGLAVSCAGSAEAFASPAFAALLDQVGASAVVLEHFAGLEHLGDSGRTPEQTAAPGRHGGAPDLPAGLLGQVLALARRPNVFVKLHGLGEFCVRAMPVSEPFPFVRPIPPLIPELLAAFGPDRLMWASDYPPVAMREGYRQALRLVMDEVPTADQAAVFGGTALAVFAPPG
jgi:L-fuconolactonase